MWIRAENVIIWAWCWYKTGNIMNKTCQKICIVEHTHHHRFWNCFRELVWFPKFSLQKKKKKEKKKTQPKYQFLSYLKLSYPVLLHNEFNTNTCCLPTVHFLRYSQCGEINSDLNSFFFFFFLLFLFCSHFQNFPTFCQFKPFVLCQNNAQRSPWQELSPITLNIYNYTHHINLNA